MRVVPLLSARETPLSIPAIAASDPSTDTDTDAAESGASRPPSTKTHSNTAPPPPIAPRSLVEFDAASDRFVHTLVDPASQLVLRRFPDESQIAFSRGVNAYVQAMRQK